MSNTPSLVPTMIARATIIAWNVSTIGVGARPPRVTTRSKRPSGVAPNFTVHFLASSDALYDRKMNEAEHHPRTLGNNPENLLTGRELPAAQQLLEHDVERSRTRITFGGQICEPSFPGDFETEIGHTVVQALPEPLRRIVRQQP